jgi:hypothetical protein
MTVPDLEIVGVGGFSWESRGLPSLRTVEISGRVRLLNLKKLAAFSRGNNTD